MFTKHWPGAFIWNQSIPNVWLVNILLFMLMTFEIVSYCQIVFWNVRLFLKCQIVKWSVFQCVPAWPLLYSNLLVPGWCSISDAATLVPLFTNTKNTDTNTQIPNVHPWNVFQCVPAWPPVCSHLPVSGCCCVYSCPLAAVWRHTTGDHRGPTHPSKTLTKLTFLHFNRDSLSWKSSYWQNITVMCCFPNTRSEN